MKIGKMLKLRRRMGAFAKSMKPLLDAQRRIGEWRKTGRAAFSYIVWVEPTNACNLRCIKCPQASGLGRPRRDMSTAEFGEIVDKVSPFKPVVALHHSGEPLMHERIFELIKIARDAGLYTVMATNATLAHRDDFRIAREGPDLLTFSIDAASREEYESLHVGGNWERVQKNVEGYFAAVKSSPAPPTTCLKIISGPGNANTIAEIAAWWSRYPFDVVEVDTQYEWPVGDEERNWPPARRGWRYFPCPAPWNWGAVLSDGRFVPCCYDALGKFDGGNLLKQSFEEIWQSEKMNVLRRYIAGESVAERIAPCHACAFRKNTRPFGVIRRMAFHSIPLWIGMAKYSTA